jgi:hypothetical protein
MARSAAALHGTSWRWQEVVLRTRTPSCWSALARLKLLRAGEDASSAADRGAEGPGDARHQGIARRRGRVTRLAPAPCRVKPTGRCATGW